MPILPVDLSYFNGVKGGSSQVLLEMPSLSSVEIPEMRTLDRSSEQSMTSTTILSVIASIPSGDAVIDFFRQIYAGTSKV